MWPTRRWREKQSPNHQVIFIVFVTLCLNKQLAFLVNNEILKLDILT